MCPEHRQAALAVTTGRGSPAVISPPEEPRSMRIAEWDATLIF